MRELEASLYLCFSGTVHDSSKIHSGIDLSEDDRAEKMKETSRVEILSALTNANLDIFDENMNKNWALKKQYSEKITSKDLDKKFQTSETLVQLQ